MAVAYEYYCKARLRHSRPRFAEDDVLDALASVFEAMLVSEGVVHEGCEQRAALFQQQMQNLGMDAGTMAMPYLEVEQANLQWGFVKRLETLSFGGTRLPQADILDRNIIVDVTQNRMLR